MATDAGFSFNYENSGARNVTSPKEASRDRPQKWTGPRHSGSRPKSRGLTETDKYQVVSPGYSIKRCKDFIEVRLEEQVCRSVKTPEDAERPSEPRYSKQASVQKPNRKEESLKERENIIEDLHEQTAKLTALLEQEIAAHERTRKKVSKELEKKVMELEVKKEEEIRILQEKHAAELLSLQQENSAKQTQEREEAENKYDDLHKELSLVKSSFKTYQESLSEEMNEAWLQKETRMKESFEEQKLIDMSRQRQSLMDLYEAEKKDVHKKALEEQVLIQQSHEAQIEDAWKKYKKAMQETKMLNVLKKHLQVEMAEKNEAIRSLNAELQLAHVEIGKLKSQIDKMEKSFDQNVSKVDSKYKHRIQSMMNENADLRRKLIAKSEQLFSQRNKDITGWKREEVHGLL